MVRAYAIERWCEAKGCITLELAVFADGMRDVCTKSNIAIETKGKRVLVRGVRFAPMKGRRKVGVKRDTFEDFSR
jgi:hypothetical protein